MNEHVAPKTQKRNITPRDVMLAAMRHEYVESVTPLLPIHYKAGEVIERGDETIIAVPKLRWTETITNGVCTKIQVPYTYRQYYAHSFEDPHTGRWEAAPGHDSKYRLTDATSAMRLHGRIFTVDELADLPTSLPDEAALFLASPESNAAAEYKRYSESHES
jgi:hypothetical protein